MKKKLKQKENKNNTKYKSKAKKNKRRPESKINERNHSQFQATIHYPNRLNYSTFL